LLNEFILTLFSPVFPDTMVNPGAFQGTRRAFLVEQKPAYATAVDEGYAVDCLADIQRRYFKRFPVDLDHNVEPSPEDLAAVDDNQPDAELQIPDPDVMPEAEYAATKEAFDARRKLVAFRKEVRDDARLITCPHRWLIFTFDL
jgi:hypothetical protein